MPISANLVPYLFGASSAGSSLDVLAIRARSATAATVSSVSTDPLVALATAERALEKSRVVEIDETALESTLTTFKAAARASTTAAGAASDPRITDVLLAAHGIDKSVAFGDIARAALKSDPTNIGSLAIPLAGVDVKWLTAIRTANLTQTGLPGIQRDSTIDAIASAYSAAVRAAATPGKPVSATEIANDISTFRDQVRNAKTVDGLLANDTVVKVVLGSAGLFEDSAFSAITRKALQSNPNSSGSLSNRLAEIDSSWAEAVNTAALYSSAGVSTLRATATLDKIAADYEAALRDKPPTLKNVPNSPGAKAREPVVAREIQAFRDGVANAKSVDDLLSNRKAMSVLLTANGLASFLDSPGIVAKALKSDVADANSVANQLASVNPAWRSTAATYDFANRGLSVLRRPETIEAITNAFAEAKWQEDLEAQTPGISFALAFKDIAKTLTEPFAILGNGVAREVVLTTLGLPPQLAYQSLEAQANAVTTRLDITRLQDKSFVDNFARRYLIARNQSTSGVTA